MIANMNRNSVTFSDEGLGEDGSNFRASISDHGMPLPDDEPAPLNFLEIHNDSPMFTQEEQSPEAKSHHCNEILYHSFTQLENEEDSVT
jgi:hypothetical protein